MKKRNPLFLLLMITLFGANVFAQGGEKGSFKKNPQIKANTGLYKEKDKKEDFLDELPKLQFRNEFEVIEKVQTTTAATQKFEPVKELNPTVSNFDTTSIDEREPLVIDIQEEMAPAGSDDFVQVASYYSIWDTENIDPYDIDYKDLDDVVDIELYNKEMGRYWSAPLNTCKQTSQFGPRWGKMHSGVDLDLETGDPVYSTFDGIVRVSGTNSGYGNFMVVRHYNGLETLYGHLSQRGLEPGAYVKATDEIGLGGSTGHSTGSHLHYETRYEGNYFNPNYIFTFSADATDVTGDHFMLSSRVFDSYGLGIANEYGSAGEKVRTRRTAWTRVHSGDTLYSIAQRAGISADKLARMNGMRLSSNLKAGKRLRVQ
jgi:murein DD-endopeptidase MepM/ murein hydrolase activator NlpD